METNGEDLLNVIGRLSREISNLMIENETLKRTVLENDEKKQIRKSDE